jgi:biopolymer transport protein ExbD
MERNNQKGGIKGIGINLIPMMDVLCVLVFFLLFHSFNSSLPDAQIALPLSTAEMRPRETVSIVVSPETVMVQGEPVVNTSSIDDSIIMVREVGDRLKQLESSIVGAGTELVADSREITLLADKTIPFKVLKKIMSTCTASGYGRISLAVVQKAEQ